MNGINIEKEYGINIQQKWKNKNYTYMLDALQIQFERLCMFGDATGFAVMFRKSGIQRTTTHTPTILLSSEFNEPIMKVFQDSIVELTSYFAGAMKISDEKREKQLIDILYLAFV